MNCAPSGIPDDFLVPGMFRRYMVRDLVNEQRMCSAVLRDGRNTQVKLSARRTPMVCEIIMLRIQTDRGSTPFMAYPGTTVLLPEGPILASELEPGARVFGGNTVQDIQRPIVFAAFYKVIGDKPAFVNAGPLYIQTVMQ